MKRFLFALSLCVASPIAVHAGGGEDPGDEVEDGQLPSLQTLVDSVVNRGVSWGIAGTPLYRPLAFTEDEEEDIGRHLSRLIAIPVREQEFSKTFHELLDALFLHPNPMVIYPSLASGENFVLDITNRIEQDSEDSVTSEHIISFLLAAPLKNEKSIEFLLDFYEERMRTYRENQRAMLESMSKAWSEDPNPTQKKLMDALEDPEKSLDRELPLLDLFFGRALYDTDFKALWTESQRQRLHILARFIQSILNGAEGQAPEVITFNSGCTDEVGSAFMPSKSEDDRSEN